MIGKSDVRASVLRALATYAVACFVVLQLLDIVQEPLGLPLTSIRAAMMLMIAAAPALVFAVAWRNRNKPLNSAETGTANGQGVLFAIGDAELNTAQRQIRFAGTPADVQPKVFDIIEYLVRARDRVVGKDELFDQIWPGVVVSEASLTQTIKRARDLFRQNGFDQDVIRTVSRKGYQFDAAVEVAGTVARDSSGVWSDIVMPTAAISAIAAVLGFFVLSSSTDTDYLPKISNAENSLVVLPFSNLTPDQDFDYFSDGLTETLTSTLTTVRKLRVIASGSAFSFRGGETSYARIGQQLNVAHIVEGSVQRSDGELRVSARLIRALDGQQVWSEIYSRHYDDVFAIQDDISRAVVEQMSGLLARQLELPDDGQQPAANSTSAEAYRLFLQGRDRRKSVSANDLQAAEGYFRAALRLRPDYPEAIVALADAVRVRAVIGELPREPAFAEAMTLIRQALELRPDYADAYVQLGEIQHRHFWDFDDAAASYLRALDFNPGNAIVHSAYGRFLSKAGEFERSIRAAEVALDLDPRSAQAASSLAIRQVRAGQLDAARSVIDAMTSMHPNNADLPWLETNWNIANGSYRDALKWIALEELDYLRLSLSAITLYHLDRTQQAQAALDELIESDPDGAAFQIAEVYAQWGQADAAFEWLERAFSHGDPGLAELYSSVNLGHLHTDPRFATFAGRVGLPPLTKS